VSSSEWAELIKLVGVPVAVLAIVVLLIVRGYLRTKQELAAKDEVIKTITQKCEDERLDKEWYRDRLDRVLDVQEQTTPVVKEAVQKRADIRSLEDMAKIVDVARQQGLIRGKR
jgi:Mg2+/Co2+ transporter CorB